MIYVSKADRVYKPVYINDDLFGGTFRRDHEEDYHCSEAEVRGMLDPTIRWTDRLESSSGEWSGNLMDFFFQMERKLLRDIKKPFKLEGITRIDDTPVHKAIREALANCIANADFNFSRGSVILKNPDKITIENPGSIITGKSQMLKGGISEPRNKSGAVGQMKDRDYLEVYFRINHCYRAK